MAELVAAFHGVSAFFGAHSLAIETVGVSVGTPVAIRATIDAITCATRPCLSGISNRYHGMKRMISEKLCFPEKCVTGIAYVCFLDGVVKRKIEERRRASQPQPRFDTQSLTVGKPYWCPNSGCTVLREHSTGPLLKCVPKTVTQNGEITYDVVAPAQLKTPAHGDEKRVKQMEVLPGWSNEDMKSTFRNCLIVVVDGKPFGIGWRSREDAFTTPFHMGPVKGKKVELVSVKDYIDFGQSADRAEIDLSSTEIHALDYAGCRSKTGFDSMMVIVNKWTFARISVPVHSLGLYKGIQGQMVSVGFDMRVDGDWKPLVVHSGELKSMPGFTALSGTVLHTINTEPGWSGTPLFRCDKPGSQCQIAAMHICAVPGLAAFNCAVSAPQLELLIRSIDNIYTPSFNCPFQDMVVFTDEHDEDQVVFNLLPCDDEKSTNKKMKTQARREERARARKSRGKQMGAPKQNVRKGGKSFGWKSRKGGSKTKSGGVKSKSLSAATYDKLKQASSIFAAKDPASMGIVHKAYRKLCDLEARMEQAQQRIMAADTSEERDEYSAELDQLMNHHDAVMRNFEYQLEGKMQAYARRAALQAPAVPRGVPWADIEDDDDDEDEEEHEGFWGGNRPYEDECAFKAGALIYKSWREHDPEEESNRVFEDEARNNYACAFTQEVPGEMSTTVSMTAGTKKECVRRLLDMEMSTEGHLKRHMVHRIMKKFINEEGKVVTVEDPLWTYLMNRAEHILHADSNTLYFKDRDEQYVFFDFVPEDPGAPGDLLISKHRLDPSAVQSAPCSVQTSEFEQKWWDDLVVDRRKLKYTGDTGGSESKTLETPVTPAAVTNDDQKRFQAFYRDYVDQEVNTVLPHRKLVRAPPAEDEIKKSLDQYFQPEGKLSDLYAIMNCGVNHLWSRPEAVFYKEYMSLGSPIWSKDATEVIPDKNGDPCFRKVGKHSPIGGGKPSEEWSALSRRVKAKIADVAKAHPEAADELNESTTYVMPSTGEAALIESLYGQSKKQKIASPPAKLREFLRYISFETAKEMPLTKWSFNHAAVGEVISHYIDAADDKSIGWTGHLFPGTRGNIQRDFNKRKAIIDLVKFRLALRFAVANSLHAYSPSDMVRTGLRDPCVAFVKGCASPSGTMPL